MGLKSLFQAAFNWAKETKKEEEKKKKKEKTVGNNTGSLNIISRQNTQFQNFVQNAAPATQNIDRTLFESAGSLDGVRALTKKKQDVNFYLDQAKKLRQSFADNKILSGAMDTAINNLTNTKNYLEANSKGGSLLMNDRIDIMQAPGLPGRASDNTAYAQAKMNRDVAIGNQLFDYNMQKKHGNKSYDQLKKDQSKSKDPKESMWIEEQKNAVSDDNTDWDAEIKNANQKRKNASTEGVAAYWKNRADLYSQYKTYGKSNVEKWTMDLQGKNYKQRKEEIDSLNNNPYSIENELSQYESGKEFLDYVKKEGWDSYSADDYITWAGANNKSIWDEVYDKALADGLSKKEAWKKADNAEKNLRDLEKKGKEWNKSDERKKEIEFKQKYADSNLTTLEDYETKKNEIENKIQKLPNGDYEGLTKLQGEWVNNYDDRYLQLKHQNLWESLPEDEQREILENARKDARVKAYQKDVNIENGKLKHDSRYLDGYEIKNYNPEYFEKKAIELKQRYSDEEAENIIEYAQAIANEEIAPIGENISREYGQKHDVVNVLINSAIKNLTGGVSGMVGNVSHRIARSFGDTSSIDWNNDSLRMAKYGQVMREAGKEDIDSNFWKNIYDAAGSGADMAMAAPSLLVPGVGKGLFTAILSSEAGTSQMIDAHERGLSDAQAVGEGVIATLAEYGSERISLEVLLPEVGKITSLKDVVKQVAKSFVAEGSEEVVSDIITESYDRMVADEKSSYNIAIQNYMDQGLSKEEATKKADKEFLNQLKNDFTVGGLAGAMFGSVTGAGSYAINKSSSSVIKSNGQKIIDNGEAENLVDFAMNMKPEGEAFRVASEISENKKKVSAKTVGELQQHVIREISEAASDNYGEIKQAAVEMLPKSGIDVEVASQGIANVLTSSDVSQKQIDVIENVPEVREVLDTLSVQYQDNTNASLALTSIARMSDSVQEQQNKGDVSPQVKNNPAIPDAVKLNDMEIKESVQEGTYHPKYNLGTAVTTMNGRGWVQEIVKTGSDSREVIVNYENGTSDVVRIDALNDIVDDAAESTLYSFATDFGFNGANVLIENADNGVLNSPSSIQAYVKSARMMYNAGLSQSASFEDAYRESGISLTMPEVVANRFYQAGFMDQKYNNAISYAQETEQKVKTKNGNKTVKEKNTTQKRNNSNAQNITHKELNVKAVAERLSDGQAHEIKTIKDIAKATGITVKFFESKPDANGRLTDDNGFFVPSSNEIWIDINAGRNVADLGRTTMLKTLSHELTHWIKNQGGNLYEQYSAAVMKHLTEARGMTEEQLVKEKMQKLNINKDIAIEEIVADASEMMLKDTNVLKEVAEQNKTWFGKVKEHILNTIAKMRAAIQKAYQGVKATSVEAKALDAMDGVMEDLQKMWDDAFVEATGKENVSLENKEGILSKNRTVKGEKGTYNKCTLLDKKKLLKDNGQEYLANDALIKMVKDSLYRPERTYIKVGKKEIILAKENDYYRTKTGRKEKVIRELIRNRNGNVIKNLVLLNLGEVVKTSESMNADRKTNEHGWLDKKGWHYRKSYIETIDGEIYAVTFNIAKNEEGNFLYDLRTKKVDDRVKPIKGSSLIQSTEKSVSHSKTKSNGNFSMRNANSGTIHKSARVDSEGRELTPQQQYMDAVKRENYEKAKELVEQYAKSKGYTKKVYHGTERFGFTKISTELSDDGFSFWATDDINLAQTYSGRGDTRTIKQDMKEISGKELYEALLDAGFHQEVDFLEKGNREDRIYELRIAVGALLSKAETMQDRLEELGDWNSVQKLKTAYAEWKEKQNNTGKLKEVIEKLEDSRCVISDYAHRVESFLKGYERVDEDLFVVDGILRDSDHVRRVLQTNGVSRGNYELLANTDNLMEIDAKGSNWNHIMYDYGTKEYSPEELVKLLKETGYYDNVSYSKKSGNYLIELNGNEKEYDEDYVKRVLKLTEEHKPNQRSIRTRDIAKDAYKKGYQGVIIKNVVDDGGRGNRYSKPSNVYIFFKPQQQLKSADPVTYDDKGNVISLEERFKSDNPDIRHSMRAVSAEDYESVIRENEELRAQVGLLERQFEVTKGHEPNMEDVQKMGRKLLKKYHTEYSIDDFSHNMQQIINFTKDSKVQNYSEVMNAMMKMARQIAEKIQEVDSGLYDQYEGLRKGLRTTRITLNEEQRAAAGERYGTYNEFRKRMMGKLRLVNDGISLDEMWQQYAEMYPELFSKETNDVDQVEELIDILSTIGTKHVDYLSGVDVDYAARDIAQEIFQEYFALPSVHTFADARIQELNDAREEYKKNLKEARKEYKERYEKKEFKDKILRLRNNLAAKITKKKPVPLGLADKVIDICNEIYRGNMNLAHVERNTQQELVKLGVSEEDAKTITDKCTLVFLEDSHESVGRSEERLEKWLVEKDINLNKVELRKVMNDVHDNYFSVAAVNKTEKALHMRLKALQETYAKFKGMDSYEWSSEFDERLNEHLKEIAEITGDKALVSLDRWELEQLYNSLKEVSHIIVEAEKQIKADNSETNQEVARKIIDETVGKKKRNITQKMAHTVNVYAEKYLLSDVRYVRSLTGYNENSQLWQLYQSLFNASRTEDKFRMDAKKPFDELTSQKEYDSFTGKKKGSLIEDAIYDINGNPVTISHSQLVQIIMSWERGQGKRHMEKGGLTIYDAKELLKGDLVKARDKSKRTVTVSESGIAKLRTLLTDYDKQWMSKAKHLFTTVSSDATNEVSMQTRGVPLATAENYIRLYVDDNFVSTESQAVKMDATLQGHGSLKATTYNAPQPLRIIGIEKVVNDNIDFSSRYYAYTIPIRNLRKALNYTMPGGMESVAQTIQESWGSQTYNRLVRIVDEIETGRAMTSSTADDEFQKQFGKLHSNFVAAALNTNLSVSIKQFASYPTAMAYIDTKNLTKALFGRVNLDEIDEHTGAHYKRRLGLSHIELEVIRNSSKLQDVLDHLPKILNGRSWITAVDCFTTAKLWDAAKYQINDEIKKTDIEKGSDTYWQMVTDLYNKVLEETQPMYDVQYRAGIQKSNNVIAKTLSMFKTQPLQTFGMIYDSLGEWKAAEQRYKANKTTENKRALRQAKKRFIMKSMPALINSAAVFTMMTLLANFAINKINPWRDDETGEIDIIGNLPEHFAQSMVSMIAPVGGSEIYDMINSFVGNGTFYDVESPSLSMINEIYAAVKKMYGYGKSIANGKEEFSVNGLLGAVEPLAFAISQMGGLELKNISNIIKADVYYIGKALGNKEIEDALGYQYKNAQLSNGYYKGIKTGDKEMAKKYLKMMQERVTDDDTAYDKLNADVKKQMYMDYYDAIKSGNEKDIEKYRDGLINLGADAKAIDSRIKGILKDNDDRVSQAAEAYMSGDFEKYEKLINEIICDGFKKNVVIGAVESIVNKQNDSSDDNNIILQEEWKKLEDWGLGEYHDQLDNGSLDARFGNVDMNNRIIIKWTDELKQKYKKELKSWGYNPETGGIDTVFGGSERFGEDILDNGIEIAFTPILVDGTNATFLSKDVVNSYINNIVKKAAADGNWTEKEILELDKHGLKIGNQFIKRIIAASDSGLDYENNNNKADLTGRLMHFAGEYGAISLAKKENDKKLYKNNDLYNTVLSDNQKEFKHIKDYLILNGKESKDIDSGIKSKLKKDYLDGNITEKQAKGYLKNYLGYDKLKIYETTCDWKDKGIYDDLNDAIRKGKTKKSEKYMQLLYQKGTGKSVDALKTGITSGLKGEFIYEYYSNGKWKELGGNILEAGNYMGLDLEKYEETITKWISSAECYDNMHSYIVSSNVKSAQAEIYDLYYNHNKEKSAILSSIEKTEKPLYIYMKKNGINTSHLKKTLISMAVFLGENKKAYEKKIDSWK